MQWNNYGQKKCFMNGAATSWCSFDYIVLKGNGYASPVARWVGFHNFLALQGHRNKLWRYQVCMLCSVSMQSVEILSFCIAIPNFCSTAPSISHRGRVCRLKTTSSLGEPLNVIVGWVCRKHVIYCIHHNQLMTRCWLHAVILSECCICIADSWMTEAMWSHRDCTDLMLNQTTASPLVGCETTFHCLYCCCAHRSYSSFL